jgi:hypothetical protein
MIDSYATLEQELRDAASRFTLAKMLRDRREAQRLQQRIEDAKTLRPQAAYSAVNSFRQLLYK